MGCYLSLTHDRLPAELRPWPPCSAIAGGSSFFPSRKSALAKKAADAVTPEYLTDEDGEVCLDENGEPIVQEGMAVFYADWEYTYHIPSREEVALTLALIEAAKPVSLTHASEVLKIISEEAAGYYQGQKTALEAAKIIQSRVGIYVNENLAEK